MVQFPYSVEPSCIPGAGKGLFTAEAVPAGKVLVAPMNIGETFPLEVLLQEDAHPHADSSIRWFEDHCTISPHWPDECYINHSFAPNSLWHLGFVFALRDLEPGEEITIDYRHIIGPGITLDFVDAQTGKPIVGHGWRESLVTTTKALLALTDKMPEPS